MERLTIVQYIRNYIDDQYAMDVLYYCLKKMFVDEKLIDTLSPIKISKKYLGRELLLSFSTTKYSKRSGLLLLMSVKAAMIDESYFDATLPDACIFVPRIDRYEWIKYYHMIEDLCEDKEFELLFNILSDSYYNNEFDEEKMEELRDSLEHPGYKCIKEYFSEEASIHPGLVTSDFIGDRAFLCNSEMVEYCVPESIEYIGNTAFAFCEQLRSITFNRDETYFGKYPIIECEKLEEIIVPVEAVNFYKEALPLYSGIIRSRSQKYVVNPDFDGSMIYRVFDKKATSYKYFWFYAILSLAKECEEQNFSFDIIVIRMVALAWPIIHKHKMDLGRVDQMSEYLDQLYLKTKLKQKNESIEVESYLLENMDESIYKIVSPLLKNAPYRFLSPWIPFESVGDVVKKSKYRGNKSPYSLNNEGIKIKDDWFNYFMVEYDNLMNFINDSFAEFLKQYNTTTKVKKAITTRSFLSSYTDSH